MGDRRRDGTDVTQGVDAPLAPWQIPSLGSGLTLHAPLPIALSPAVVDAAFRAVDAGAPPQARRHHGAGRPGAGAGWTSIAFLETSVPSGPVEATPALALAPALADLLAHLANQQGLDIRRSHIARQAPWGGLPWHYDNQAVHLEECRLLLPLVAPPGATTMIGHERVAYPAGRLWTGDFSFPHQVENPSDQARIVLVVDARCTPALRHLAPPALAADIDLRLRLAQVARNILLAENTSFD